MKLDPARCRSRRIVVGSGSRRNPAARNLRKQASVWGEYCTKDRNSHGAHVSIRPIRRIIQSKPTIEGAGVRLRRAFGFRDPDEYDPFLLLDDFRNERPDDYMAGFPWHPHRGIETITYVLK